MAFYFTEEQVLDAARKAFRDYATWSHGAFAACVQEGATLAEWTNADAEREAIGEALKLELAR